MSVSPANHIVERLGPVTVALVPANPALEQDFVLAGCRVVPAEQADATTVGVLLWADEDAATRLIDRAGTLVVLSGGADRAAVEARLFGRGWSRHPAGLGAVISAAATDTALPPLAFFRRCPRAEDDVLVRGDAEADALLALAARAAEKVRAGDEVLVVGEQAAAAGEVLAALSRAGRVEVPAMAALAEQPPHEAGAVFLLADDAATIDPSLLAAVRRALRPDGRLLLAWPAGANGVDAVRDQVDEQFISESWVVLPRRPAGAVTVMLDNWPTTALGDRVLLVASANPLVDTDAPAFSHPAFSPGDGEGRALTDFAAAYDNPWLYRVMVQLGERLGDEVKLARLAECVLDEAAEGSADRGAAICVLGYRVHDLRLTDSIGALLALIERYLAKTEGTAAPHLLRWRLSLLFLAGRLSELASDADAALGWYERSAEADWQGFSPLLATKAIAARYHAARLLIAVGNHAAALEQFRRGLDAALAAAAAPHDRLIGDRDSPLPFYLPEMAEILDMGAQCANAIAAAPLLARDPGLFWRQIDVKRFGLFAWADALAKENARLRGG